MIITVVKALIEVEAGWAVGAADATFDGIDRELLTDRDGQPWVPASSLAGSLRAHLAATGADITLMGDRPPEQPGAANPQPSALWLLNTETRATADARRAPATTVVANTAVDPARRAAQATSLRFTRIVDQPATIELYAQAYTDLTDTQLDLIAGWQPAIGRDRTRGGGNARLAALGFRRYDLDQPADLDAWLTHPGHGRFTGLTTVTIADPPEPARIEACWQIVDGLHIGTGSIDARKTALTRTRDGQPLVPGSTWKGLFRARTGYIMRSLWGQTAACLSHTGCGHCALCDLFGSSGRRGRLAFADSPITTAQTRPATPAATPQPHPAPTAAPVPSARPSPAILAGRPRPNAHVPAAAPPTPGIPARTHVAIDRITGGARDKLLFTQEIVTDGTLTVRITALSELADWEHDLLLHVIRDLHDGLIGLGKGAQRGQGTLRLAPESQAVLDGLRPVPTACPREQTP